MTWTIHSWKLAQQLAFHSAVQKALHDFASFVNVPPTHQIDYRVALQHTHLSADIEDIDLSVVSDNELPHLFLVDELLPRLQRPAAVFYSNHTTTRQPQPHQEQEQDEAPNLFMPSNALDQYLADFDQSPRSQPSHASANNHNENNLLLAPEFDQPRGKDPRYHDRDNAHYLSIHTFANQMPATSQQQTKLDLSRYLD